MTTESDVSSFAKGVAFSRSGASSAINGHGPRERLTSVSEDGPVQQILQNKDTRKFVERPYRCDPDLEYQRPGKEPGLVVIFGQENFDHHKQRKGTRRDVNEIVLCLQRQGYNIDVNDILMDGTSAQIVKKLDEVSERDLTQYNSLIVFFLTHGDLMNQLYTKDGYLWANDVWKTFENSLKGKPKMFVFQACKGGSSTNIGQARRKSSQHFAPVEMFEMNYIPEDFLIVFSTLEGNVSFRNTAAGSWFIQELCKNFLAYGQKDDVFSLLIRTCKCVCGNYYLFKENELKKQMPVVVSTLTKKFYLNTNKFRDHYFEMIDMINTMHDNLTKIQQNIADLCM